MTQAARIPSHREATNPSSEQETLTNSRGAKPQVPPVGAGQRAGPGAGLAASVPADTWYLPAARMPGQGGCSGRPRLGKMGRDRTGLDATRAVPPHLSTAFQGAAPGTRKELPKAEMEPPLSLPQAATGLRASVRGRGVLPVPQPQGAPPTRPTALINHSLDSSCQAGGGEDEARGFQRHSLTSTLLPAKALCLYLQRPLPTNHSSCRSPLPC